MGFFDLLFSGNRDLQIVQDYGDFLKKQAQRWMKESELPHSKKTIKKALIHILKKTSDEKTAQSLKTAYGLLAYALKDDYYSKLNSLVQDILKDVGKLPDPNNKDEMQEFSKKIADSQILNQSAIFSSIREEEKILYEELKDLKL